MATITFPTLDAAAVTVDVDDITELQPAGALTIVIVQGGHFYRSPAPIELFEVALQEGATAVALQTSGPFPPPPPDEGV